MALQAEALFKRLQQDGIAVELIATNPVLSRATANIRGVRTLTQGVLFVCNLIRALRRNRVVHLLGASHWYFVLRVVPTLVLGKLFRRQVILNYRGGEAPGFFAQWAVFAVPIVRLADVITVPSSYLFRVFERYSLNPTIIGNFVDLERFRFRQRDRLEPRLLVTRTLEPLYNIKMAIKAFAIVQKKYPCAHLDVVGGGSEESNLKAWVRRQGWTGIDFHGAVPNQEIFGFLDRADILLNPTNADNLPMNLLEAFAAGVPVVTTNVGGIRDLVGQDEAALTVNPDDAASMAVRIEQLLSEPQTVVRITQEAKSRSERFTWDKIGRSWIALYQTVNK